ncbi:MAG: DUF2847 family protein [Saprospirales bacterium]|nr:DUF2847 family protein [Saprospirales bacterium]
MDLLEKKQFAVLNTVHVTISTMAKNRVEREWNLDFPIFIRFTQLQAISNLIAKKSEIEHQSPQLLFSKWTAYL